MRWTGGLGEKEREVRRRICCEKDYDSGHRSDREREDTRAYSRIIGFIMLLLNTNTFQNISSKVAIGNREEISSLR